MQKTKVILSVFVLSLVVGISGCGSDDGGSSKGSITVTLDGQALKVKLGSTVLLKGIDNDQAARTLNINVTVNGDILIFTASGWDFNGHPENGLLAKKYYADLSNLPETECGTGDLTSYCESGTATYTIGTTDFYSSIFTETGEGYIEVTSCDPAKKKISGKIHVKIDNDMEDPGKMLEGEFKDISYIIQN